MKNRSIYRTKGKRGVALVMVLSVLVLLTALTLAFFTTALSEADLSNNRRVQSEGDRLADTVAHLVIGQIRQATTRSAAREVDPAAKFAWASQPGAIRSYDTSENQSIFKLYSSSDMNLNGTAAEVRDELDADIPAGDFTYDNKDYGAVWTDLNSPVDKDGVLFYPIVDPSASTTVEGFSFDSSGVSGASATRLPMPAKWLYVTKHSIHYPNASSSNSEVELNHNYGASGETNRPVGRIAFWTDDETSKINVNTASKGEYTGLPVDLTEQDFELAWFQPAKNEVQRYPGHPATVNLDKVFTTLTAADIFKITPRVAFGGSEGASRRTLDSTTVSYDGDRLYASVDEILYSSDRGDNSSNLTEDMIEVSRFFVTAHSRAPEVNILGKPRISLWPINDDETKGTAYDRIITFCSTIESEGGKRGYIFKRKSSASPDEDISLQSNEELYDYAKELMDTVIPGFGGKFSTKFGSDSDQILTQMFDYIRSSINLHDPGVADGDQFTTFMPDIDVFQGAFNAGYGQITPMVKGSTKGFGRIQTITEAAIHFICTADSGDGGAFGLHGSWTPEGSTVASSPLGKRNLTLEAVGSPNEAAPAVVVGAEKRRIEAVFHLELYTPAAGMIPLSNNITIELEGLEQFQITNNGNSQALNFPATGQVTVKYPDDHGGVSGYHDFFAPLEWHNRITDSFYRTEHKVIPRARGLMPAQSVSPQTTSTRYNFTPGDEIYPFFSDFITVDYSGGNKMTLSAANLVAKVYSGSGTNKVLVQTINLVFPEQEMPIPSLAGGASDSRYWTFSRDGISNQAPDFGRLRGTSRKQHSPASGAFIQSNDVVRAILPLHGDYRLLAAMEDVPASMFQPAPEYTNPDANHAHRLRHAQETKAPGNPNAESVGSNRMGTYVQGRSRMPRRKNPDIVGPVDYPGGTEPWKWSEWSNGMGHMPDGPFINKANEGARPHINGSRTSVPYLTSRSAVSKLDNFTPNRQVPSAGIMGSLPTNVKRNSGNGSPWETLLFRPDPDGTHPGANNPPDYLLMDLFWMPIVEPYAISEPFSTAGRVNVNHEIAPYNYITRTTALRAALDTEKVVAIPDDAYGTYKGSATVSGFEGGGYLANPESVTWRAGTQNTYRFPIESQAVFDQMDTLRFDSGDIFRSAAEFCEVNLLQRDNGTTRNAGLTGDNMLEAPYAAIYPKLTSKSNTFRVHYRVQTLKQTPSGSASDGNWHKWNEDSDKVMAEQRGFYLIERFIDPNDTRLGSVDFATDANATVEDYYQYRIVSHKKFSP